MELESVLGSERAAKLGDGLNIQDMAVGLDHAVLLAAVPSADAGPEEQVLMTCGRECSSTFFSHSLKLTPYELAFYFPVNTDGQLGLGPPTTPDTASRISSPSFISLPLSQLNLSPDDSLVGVAAGGDTSFAWSQTGRVWAWGNSEYGQGLHGRAIDRIDAPLEATEALPSEMGKVVQIAAGGPFVVVLDGELLDPFPLFRKGTSKNPK